MSSSLKAASEFASERAPVASVPIAPTAPGETIALAAEPVPSPMMTGLEIGPVPASVPLFTETCEEAEIAPLTMSVPPATTVGPVWLAAAVRVSVLVPLMVKPEPATASVMSPSRSAFPAALNAASAGLNVAMPPVSVTELKAAV